MDERLVNVMKFDCKQIMDMMLVKRKIKLNELAKKLDCVPGNIVNKRKRNNMRIEDLAEIAAVLDFDMKIVFTDKITGEDMTF